jgi:methylated-DNA-[protein]-cysteine S-methyltransferase
LAVPDTQKILYSWMRSPVGELLLAASATGLCRVQFGGTVPAGHHGEMWVAAPEQLQQAKEELSAYFRGTLRDFTVPLDLRGTPFQIRCWEALRRIPYGSTCSYGELAAAVGSPRAFRAVGQANHNNPIAIIVPCHRVIGANGSLTGYGGGLSLKEQLLRLERGEPQALFSFAETA